MSEERSQSAVEASIALRVAIGRLRRRMRDVASGEDLTPAQVSALARLAGGEATTSSALAVLEGVRPQSMATVVGSLVDAGLVSRSADPADGRQQLLALTEAGLDAYRATKRARGEWLARTLDEDFDEAERQTMIEAAALLERLARA